MDQLICVLVFVYANRFSEDVAHFEDWLVDWAIALRPRATAVVMTSDGQ